jgi:hypothetical protein
MQALLQGGELVRLIPDDHPGFAEVFMKNRDLLVSTPVLSGMNMMIPRHDH